MVLLTVGVSAARLDGPLPMAEALTTAIGLVLLVGLAGAAGISLGQSPGQDILSIARRLDAAGYTERTGALDAPVVVTSFDEIGQLLANLELVRSRLADELHLYQEALDKTRDADALKSEFLSAVSHELRTPLNVVGGFAQLLLEGVPTPLSESQAEDVRLIRAGGHQLLELINDILDMSMIESGELRLSFAATDVEEVIQDVVQIQQPLVRDRGVALTTDPGRDLPLVVCDRRRLTQILTNLVSNAIKFTESGSITVRASYEPRRSSVLIRCIDTGIGIARADLDTIFEEYRQVGSLKRRKKGTGLGLAIARRIALAHGGALTVESEVGEGSTFTLELPLDPPSRPRTLQAAEATTAIRRTTNPRIARSLVG
jgi:signal transduction histidine kinase